MNRRATTKFIGLMIIIALGSIIIMQCGQNETLNYRDATFASLQEIRQTKEKELAAYFKPLHEKTLNAKSDTLLTNLFNAGSSHIATIAISSDYEESIDRHFVNNYGEFYDLLWVDASGFVFHSVRQESDYGTNLFEDTVKTGLLSALKQATGPIFVDFEYYSPSEEPGAFQIIPVKEGPVLKGWMVFQLSINRINSILTDHRRMGRTGEVYLVNSSGLMLSQSRFSRNSTILNKKIETEPVKAAARAQTGNLLTKDYRGVSVFSSFSRIDVFGVIWYVVAEIDEAEVITSHFSGNRKAMRSHILNQLRRIKSRLLTESIPATKSIIRVDMNEYGSARSGQRIQTSGVATCTAVAITFPGRFAYLAHVSPTDQIYRSNSAELFGVSHETDLLSRLLEQIDRYEVYPYEADRLQFVVIAVHDESCWNIIDQLIQAGYYINQIKILYNPEMQYANVTIMEDAASVQVDWFSAEKGILITQSSEVTPDLGLLTEEFSRHQQQIN